MFSLCGIATNGCLVNRSLSNFSTVRALGCGFMVLLIGVMVICDLFITKGKGSNGEWMEVLPTILYGVVLLFLVPTWTPSSRLKSIVKVILSQYFQFLALSLLKRLHDHKYPDSEFHMLRSAGMFAFAYCFHMHWTLLNRWFPSNFSSKYNRFIETYSKWKLLDLSVDYSEDTVISYGAVDDAMQKMNGRKNSALSNESLMFNGYLGPIPMQRSGLSSLVDKLYSVSPKNTYHLDDVAAEALAAEANVQRETTNPIGAPEPYKARRNGSVFSGEKLLRLSRSLKSLEALMGTNEEKQLLKNKLSQYTFGKNSVCSESTLRDSEPRSILDSRLLYQAYIESSYDYVDFPIDPSFKYFGTPGWQLSQWWVLAYTCNATLEFFASSICWVIIASCDVLSHAIAAMAVFQFFMKVLSFIIAPTYYKALYLPLITNVCWFLLMINVIFSI